MRYIKPEFWTDSALVSLSRDARLFYIGTWNFALCEAGHLEDDALRLKMQIFPADNVDVSALLDELLGSGRIVRESVGGYLRIVKLPEHQKTDPRWTPRCAACKALSELAASTGEPLPDSPKLSATLPNSPKNTTGGDRRGGEGIGKQPSSEVADATPRPDVLELLDHLDQKIKANGARTPSRSKANIAAARLLLDVDKHTVAQVKAAIDYATGDEFWRANVLSMSKLREKYDQLRLHASRSPGKNGQTVKALPTYMQIGHADYDASLAALGSR